MGENGDATRANRTRQQRGRNLAARAERPPERVLYFTYSAGYRHDVIPLSRAILTQLGTASGAFQVIATEDLSEFSAQNLEQYAAVMFFTSGEIPMSGVQKTALLDFVRAGRPTAQKQNRRTA